jgi:VWFA-related protein
MRLVAVALLALWGIPAVSQVESEVFTETIDVQVVNVEVVVTGRDGERVSGLGSEDFRLVVAGEEVEIDFYTEVREGRALTRSWEPAEATTPAPAVDVAQDRVGTHYLLFIDESSVIGAERDRLLARLRAQIDSLRPEDQLALVGFDGRQVDLIQGWSGDAAQLREALTRAERRPTRGINALAELRRLSASSQLERNSNQRTTMYRSHGSVAGDSSGYEQYLVDNSYLGAHELDLALTTVDRVEATVAAAAAALRAVPAAAGRKVLLLLAGDLPFSVGQYVAAFTSPSAERVITDSRLPTGEELYASLVETANLLGYTLYPIDAGGVTTAAASVEMSGPLEPFQLAALSDAENEVHFSLMHLADETGGKAIMNTANVEALERVIVDTASYYWLGFYASRQGDDARHEIRVEVNRPGVQVRARKGFVDLSPAVERDLAVESALLLGPAGVGEPLGVEVGEPRRKRGDRGRMMVPLTLVVPAAALEFQAQGEGGPWVAELDLRLTAVDREGGRTEPLRVPVTLTLPTRPGPQTMIRYQAEVELRRLEQRVAVLLHDPATLRTLAGRVDVAPR